MYFDCESKASAWYKRSLRSLLLISVASYSSGVPAADNALPTSVKTCADVERVVSYQPVRNEIEQPELRPDGTWSDAAIRVDRSSGATRLIVEERDIDLFIRCWEEIYRSDRTGQELDRNLDVAITRFFPMTERVAGSLAALDKRALENDWPRYRVLNALSMLGLTPSGADGTEADALERRRAEIAPAVTRAMLDQWWQCWERAAKKWDEDAATYRCRAYSGVVNKWLLGDVGFGDEAQRAIKKKAAEDALRVILSIATDPQERQVAVLAAFDRQALWDASTRLGRQALNDHDPRVRLMAVRLADYARIDNDGQPADAEFRRALTEIARSDRDAAIRKEAMKILALPPFGGPG